MNTDFTENKSDSSMTLKPGRNASVQVKFIDNFHKEDKRPFTTIGELKSKTSYSKETKFDPLDRFSLLTKAGRSIFLTIKDNRDRDTNLATVPYWAEADKTESRYINRGLQNLIGHRIICKALPFGKFSFAPPPHTYMIDPLFIKCNFLTEAKEFWAEFTKNLMIKKEYHE